MGLFYRVMIKEIREKFLQSGETDLEEFLKEKESSLKEEYQLPEELFILNICQLLKEENIESSYFKERNDYEDYI